MKMADFGKSRKFNHRKSLVYHNCRQDCLEFYLKRRNQSKLLNHLSCNYHICKNCILCIYFVRKDPEQSPLGRKCIKVLLHFHLHRLLECLDITAMSCLYWCRQISKFNFKKNNPCCTRDRIHLRDRDRN